MSRALGTTLLVGTATLMAGCSGEEQPDSLGERASYAIGVDFGNNLKQAQASDLDVDVLVEGLRDALGEGEPRMNREEMQQVLQEFSAKVQRDMAQRQSELMASNQEEGEAFLAENRTKAGIVETESGLQYEILNQGTGASPTATDRVTVHYEGRLVDGTVFDSSYERGDPSTFAVNGVIAGWTEAIQLMTVGSKYRLFIPGGLAYRERGRSPSIGPNAMLIFEVELLGIER